MMAVRLRTSPNFTLALSFDGRAYISREVEPYTQFWLTERERWLFSLFAKRGGMDISEAVAAFMRLTGRDMSDREAGRIAKEIGGMRDAGVLLASGDDTSRYAAKMARDYLAHRPFPRGVSDHLIARAPVVQSTKVLDLAGGPGSLALELARTSINVSMMELSKGFVAAAQAEAKRRGVLLNAINDSCNRLVHHDAEYDVITVSQALHWLDDVMVCKGVCRLLRAGGSFFVVHGSLSLDDVHPLSYILGDKTPLGDKAEGSFSATVSPLLKRLTLLFEALDTPDVERIDPGHALRTGEGPIVPVATTLFRQQRPIGEGFARAFLSETHIAMTGQTPGDFWADLSRRCAASTPDLTIGTQEWALLHFQRGGERMARLDLDPEAMIEIGWDG